LCTNKIILSEMYFERKNIITSDVNCQTFEILTMPNKDMKSNDPSKTKKTALEITRAILGMSAL